MLAGWGRLRGGRHHVKKFDYDDILRRVQLNVPRRLERCEINRKQVRGLIRKVL